MERQGVQIPSPPVVDREALLERVEGDTGLLTELPHECLNALFEQRTSAFDFRA